MADHADTNIIRFPENRTQGHPGELIKATRANHAHGPATEDQSLGARQHRANKTARANSYLESPGGDAAWTRMRAAIEALSASAEPPLSPEQNLLLEIIDLMDATWGAADG